MKKSAKIYVAGHSGLVGMAITKKLKTLGYDNILVRSHDRLDLTCQEKTEAFFKKERPDYVFLAAGKVGGILANDTYKADFIYENAAIALNVIHAAHKYGVKKLLNLGSACIYPKEAPQPIRESYLLTGPLEPTNEPYAVAKILAIKLCRYYREQYGANFISAMPTNLYGPNDNFDPISSHVLPALICKFHTAKLLAEGSLGVNAKCLKKYGITRDVVTLWGSGAPYREFLHVDDLADASIFLMKHYDAKAIGEIINIGSGKDLRIRELADLVKGVVDFRGCIEWDRSKPDGMFRKVLDVARMRKLGWRPKIKLEDGIRKTYEWYLKNSVKFS